MNGIRPNALLRGVPARCIRVGHILAVIAAVGMVLMLTAGLTVVFAVCIGSAPEFDQLIVLDARHQLVIHNGPIPTCTTIPIPPQHDCFWPGTVRRAFSVDELTPAGARSLVWFRLPQR